MIKVKIKTKKSRRGKSNRMIWAVAAGITLIFLLFAFLLFYQKKPANVQEQLNKALSYLKPVEGIVKIQVDTAPNRVLIIYDSNFQKDFEQIAHFAAVRLASQVDACTVQLAKNTADQIVYRIDTQGGAIVNEERRGR